MLLNMLRFPFITFFASKASPFPLSVSVSKAIRKPGRVRSQMASFSSSSSSKLLFRQLFEKESSTYTYLLADASHPERPALVGFSQFCSCGEICVKGLKIEFWSVWLNVYGVFLRGWEAFWGLDDGFFSFQFNLYTPQYISFFRPLVDWWWVFRFEFNLRAPQ